MTGVLARILDYKRTEIAAAKKARPLDEMRASAQAAPRPRGFLSALRATSKIGHFSIIGEIKQRSPSKGVIRPNFSPLNHAQAYARGGAACLSVLTDGPSFGGHLDHIAAIRTSGVPLPMLRKDFLFDPYQVFEARAAGADAVLVILAAVEDTTARNLIATAHALDLDVIVEVHDSAECERALRLDASAIGINNRDLHTFNTTLATTETLAPRIPNDRLVIAESGLSQPTDLQRLAEVGVTSFLIGEHLMRAPDIALATRALVESRAMARS